MLPPVRLTMSLHQRPAILQLQSTALLRERKTNKQKTQRARRLVRPPPTGQHQPMQTKSIAPRLKPNADIIPRQKIHKIKRTARTYLTGLLYVQCSNNSTRSYHNEWQQLYKVSIDSRNEYLVHIYLNPVLHPPPPHSPAHRKN